MSMLTGHGDNVDPALGGGLHHASLLGWNVPDLCRKHCARFASCVHRPALTCVALQYVSASPKATRLTRFTADEVEQGGLPFELNMDLQGSAKGRKGAKAIKGGVGKRKANANGGGGATKRPRVGADDQEDDEEDEPEFTFADGDEEEEDPEIIYERFMSGEIGNPSSGWGQDEVEIDSD